MSDTARLVTVAWFSLKGGVGRTMSLANTAALLRNRDCKVGAIDLDIEAPGLHTIPPFSGTRYEPDSMTKPPVHRSRGVSGLLADLADGSVHLDAIDAYFVRAGMGTNRPLAWLPGGPLDAAEHARALDTIR